jgi:hypothetical protein
MFSQKTLFPFDYYDLPVCGKNEATQIFHELGEILTGHTISSTIYNPVINKVNTICQIACIRQPLSDYQSELYNWLIQENYRAPWYADNLPAGLNMSMSGMHSSDILYDNGIPLGEIIYFNDLTKFKLYNHLTFNIHVHRDHSNLKNDTFSVVEFNIVPYRYILLK